jgi:hypothetical protein
MAAPKKKPPPPPVHTDGAMGEYNTRNRYYHNLETLRQHQLERATEMERQKMIDAYIAPVLHIGKELDEEEFSWAGWLMLLAFIGALIAPMFA